MSDSTVPTPVVCTCDTAYAGLPEWERELLAGAYVCAHQSTPNPHAHCDCQDTTPCPTGEHVNPAVAPVGADAHWVDADDPSVLHGGYVMSDLVGDRREVRVMPVLIERYTDGQRAPRRPSDARPCVSFGNPAPVGGVLISRDRITFTF